MVPVIPNQIRRINDKTYVFDGLNNQKVNISIGKKSLDAETRYHLAAKAQKVFSQQEPSKQFKTLRFRFGNKKWKVFPCHRLSLWQRILSLFISFFYVPHNDNRKFLKVESAWIGPNSKKNKAEKTKRNLLQKELKAKTRNEFARTNINHSELNSSDYVMGCRAAMELNPSGKTIQMARYSDPFTQLSTLAFQRYESNFTSHDYKKPEDCDYRFILVDNTLKLVHKKSPLIDPSNKKRAFDQYYKDIVELYGEEKVKAISFRFRLNFGKLEELTPEHVYRFNIGAAQFGSQDLDAFLKKVNSLAQKAKDSQFTNENLIKACSSEFSLIETKALIEAISSVKPFQDLQGSDFLSWLTPLQPLPEKWSELKPDVFTKLANLLYPKTEEIERSYTGRKIFEMITGAYRTAGHKELKPHVDQQELTQIYEKLIQCKTWTAYCELLSHVVVKKHLALSYPDGDRVGTLIPAPPIKPGFPIRWYVVTSCISNGFIHSYTLESVDRTMPDIIMKRSTSSADYAFLGRETIMSDMNNVNPPGYMGIQNIEKYQEPFFNDRTIPLWVGYLWAAKKELSSTKVDESLVFALLKKANITLQESKDFQNRSLNFREIIKKHDLILEEFFLEGEKILPHERKTFNLASFAQFFKHLMKRYIQISSEEFEKISLEKIKKDAKELNQFLSKFLKEEPSLRDKLLCENLISDLKKHITSKNSNVELTETECKESDSTPEMEALKKWALELENYSKTEKENPECKIGSHLILTGHSLGGACAQVAMAHYITNKMRIPLPGYSCKVVVFDEPKISEADNSRFKKLGNEHYELTFENDRKYQFFKKLGIAFGIIRRHEAGDFVPLGGEAHLGATFSTEEEQMVSKWLEFDAAVHEFLPKTSATPDVAFSRTVHETRFGMGEKQRTWETAEIVQAPNPDYLETHYTTKIQGIFDRRGRGIDIPEKKSRAIYRHLYQKIWKISRLYERVLREEMRRSVHPFWNFFRKVIFKFKAPQIPSDHQLDEYGNLSVMLN